MPYYEIRNVGDHGFPVLVNEKLDKVFEKDNKYFYKETYKDSYDNDCEGEVQVYLTKAEAWFVIFKELDAHIKIMQEKRNDLFFLATKDGYSCISSEFIEKRMNEVK